MEKNKGMVEKLGKTIYIVQAVPSEKTKRTLEDIAKKMILDEVMRLADEEIA